MRGNRDRWIYRLVLSLGVLLTADPLRQAIGIEPDCPECTFWNGYDCVLEPDAYCSPGDPRYGCGECCDCQNCRCVQRQNNPCRPVGNCTRPCQGSLYWCWCANCRCWEPEQGIQGSGYNFTAGMCTPYGVTVTAWDQDTYRVYGWLDPQYGYDQLMYQWEKVAVSNPQTGLWVGNSNPEPEGPNVVWLSPPCIGTVKLRVRVDDLAKLDPNYDCPGSNRDDPYVVKEFLVNVVLPGDCNEGQNCVDFRWRGVVPGNPCRGGDCGATLADIESKDWQAVYNNCAWEPVCTIYGGVQQAVCVSDWDCSSLWPVTAENFEFWVRRFRETASDPNNPRLTGVMRAGPWIPIASKSMKTSTRQT